MMKKVTNTWIEKTTQSLIANAKLLIIASVGVVILAACGGGGGGGGSGGSDTPDPYTPPPDPPAATFPVQVAQPNISVINDNGSLIIAASGLSLYTFDNDSMATSTCEGTPEDLDTCAGKWPPLLAGDGAVANATMTIITRSDGDMQWALKDMPLYNYYQDSAQGDITGDGIGGIWHLARPMPLATSSINNLATYVGNETIATVSSNAGMLEAIRSDKEGFTLYTFDNDPLDDTACTGDCINIWPPLLADVGAMAMAPLSIISTSNGNMQWAFKSKLLYFFANDNAAGETNGDEINNVWHIATQEPAIQRTTDNSRSLSATGLVNVLMSVAGSTTEFSVTAMDKDGFSLYVFDNDSMDTSNCEGQCLVNWPAFVPNDEDVAIGSFTIFERSDGTKQWAHNSMPVYFFLNDSVRGDINGDGINGVWHLIEPTITTSLKQEVNALGASITVTGQVHVMVRDPNTMAFVDNVMDKSDFALYTFDNDTDGVSNCEDACLDAWPPLLADDSDSAVAPFTIITRSNGMKQWAINDMALYFFTSDMTTDDTLGENINDIWHVARPAPVKVDNHNTKGDLLVGHGDVLSSQGKTAAQLLGLTLYTFDSDVKDSGISVCFNTNNCAITWPPLYATSAEQAFGDFTIINRDENGNATLQWAYQGLPLYFYVGDSQVGDTSGEYPLWTIARP